MKGGHPGVFRRTYTEDGGRSDEAFTRKLRWECSTSLISAERGGLQDEFIEITEDEAGQIVEPIRAKVTGTKRLSCAPASAASGRCDPLVGRRLQREQLRVGPPDGHELLVRSRLHHTPISQHINPAQRLLAWAAAWPERTWAIEGAGGLGHLLAQQLLAAGEQVLDVQPKLGARVRLLATGAVLDDLRRIDALLREAKKKLDVAVRASGTILTEVFGVGPVVAATVIGAVRDVSRFPDRDCFAAYNGTAPIEVSSGPRKIYRLSRRGNRRLNHVIHIAAVTQIRYRHTDGRAYCDRKLAEGKTPKEALRSLKRQISDAIFAHLQTDAHQAAAGPR